MDLKGPKLIFVGFILLALYGTAFSGFCFHEYECKKPCQKTFDFLKFIGIVFTYSSTCVETCQEKACCTGYTGENCSELTNACKEEEICAGHKCTEQYTEGCMCKKEEKINDAFMGKDSRTILVQCEHPCERIICCSGYKGDECNEKVRHILLDDTEIATIKRQLMTDEVYSNEVYIDSEGPAFGIGHIIRITDEENGEPVGTKVSDKRIQEAFEADVHIAATDVTYMFPKACGFPTEVKEILVNMMFALRRRGMRVLKPFIAAVNARDWNTAAAEIENKQVGDPNRALRLAEKMKAVNPSNDAGDLGGSCGDLTPSELRKLYNSKVEIAEYMTRPLQGIPSSSSGRKKRFWGNYKVQHAGVRVTLTDDSKWLIHKGNNFGDVSTTVITSAKRMSSM